MDERHPTEPEQGTPAPDERRDELLPFRPWMLAAAVILACALGVAVMEELRAPELWAQASVGARP